MNNLLRHTMNWRTKFLKGSLGGLAMGILLGCPMLIQAQKTNESSSESRKAFYPSEHQGVLPAMAIIQQWQIHRPVAPGQLLDSAYDLCREIGITSLQSYVGWAQLEPEPGKISYRIYDPVVRQIRRHGLKWLPFLIAGPYIATPQWFREQQGCYAVCLEHHQPTRIQSIWNPQLIQGVKRFLELFEKHYDTACIEAIELGISGNWGEALYPVSGGFRMEGVHTHPGWWCGDPYARADFQHWLKQKYSSVEQLNARWKSDYTRLDQIAPFIPAHAPSSAAAVDMGNWYTQSMTHYAELWVKMTRALFPALPVYLCVGGDGHVSYGADFGALAKMCAGYHAGIRITNMDDNMLNGFAITRMVSSACRFYGSYYTSEPGGDNSTKGIAGRIFDIVSGGGQGLYFKSLYQKFSDLHTIPDHPSPNDSVFARFKKFLVPNHPDHPIAALMPNSSIILDGRVLNDFLQRAAQLRDLLDYDYVDENMAADGALSGYRALVVLAGTVLQPKTIHQLTAWIKSGGVLITSSLSGPLKSVTGQKVVWALGKGNKTNREVISEQAASREGQHINVSIDRLGKGYLVHCPGNQRQYMGALGDLLFTDRAPWKQLTEKIDGKGDDILATRVGDSIYYLNNGDKAGNIFVGGKLRIEPRSIIAVSRSRLIKKRNKTR